MPNTGERGWLFPRICVLDSWPISSIHPLGPLDAEVSKKELGVPAVYALLALLGRL